MSTFNKSSVQQTEENVRRIRRDQLTSPAATPAAFVNPEGSTQAVPGNEAPYARVPPFCTPFQAFGIPMRSAGIISSVYSPQKWPVIDVTEWRKITIGLKYYVPTNMTGKLNIMPFYGQTPPDNFETIELFPRMVPNPVPVVDGTRLFTVMMQEAFQTPIVANGILGPYRLYWTLDVSEFTAFTITAFETNTELSCDPESEEPLCSNFEFTYALSM
jgi:hypothetical protein